MSATWNPSTHDDYDILKGFEVYSADDEKLGTIKDVLHPREEMPAARGKHYFRVEPGMMKKLFSDQEEIFVPERLVQTVRSEDHRVVLEVTKDWVQGEDWATPSDVNVYRHG